MRSVHRAIALVGILFGLYVGLTGTSLQLLDLHSILTNAPMSDPNMSAIHDGEAGPANFQVLLDSDYPAPALPRNFDIAAAFGRITNAARAASTGAPISYVELRMEAGRPIGKVSAARRLLSIDAVTGAMLVGPAQAPLVLLPQGANNSLRNRIKNIHRMTAYGNYGIFFFLLLAFALAALLVTGLGTYFRLLRGSAFWIAGGWLRTLHRSVSVIAALFLSVILLSGITAAVGSAGISVVRMLNNGKRPGLTADVSSPLTDMEIPEMLRMTMSAVDRLAPGAPVKIVRLRYFAGMPQGVVVTGGSEVRQIVINTASGIPASLTEPNYPFTGQTFGWQADQVVKKIHRGDVFGLSGRMLSLLTGLSLIFLSVSGAIMYAAMWTRRRRAGRTELIWR